MRRGARPGMTLIEVLVALSIASIVAVIGYAAFAAVTDQAQRVARESPDLRAAAVRRALAGWLRSAMIIPGVEAASFRGLDDPRGEFPADAISFLTAAPTPLGTQPTLAAIYIDADSTTPERGLVATLRALEGELSQTIVLDSLAEGLDVSYRSSLLAEERWLPSWVSTSVLPDAAELRFIVGSSASPIMSRPLSVRIGVAK